MLQLVTNWNCNCMHLRAEFAGFLAVSFHVTKYIAKSSKAITSLVFTLLRLATKSTKLPAMIHCPIFPLFVWTDFASLIITCAFRFRCLIFAFFFTAKVAKLTTIFSHECRVVIRAGGFSKAGTIFMQIFARSTILDVRGLWNKKWIRLLMDQDIVHTSDGSVNSCSQKIHLWKQFLAFHGIMIHFSSILWSPVHTKFRIFQGFQLKSHSKIQKIVNHGFHFSCKCWNVK